MANTAGEEELKTKYPITEGIIGGTTSQTGRIMNLVAEDDVLILKRNQVGL